MQGKRSLRQGKTPTVRSWEVYRFNAIGPSYVETEFTVGLWNNPTIYEELKNKNLLKRFALPEEIVGTAIFLALDEASFITGQTLFVDGGWLTI
jgi:NAD(P)-dependent dehydrogenase (short-subunit alcohol dehydrogenase family)